MRSSVAAGGGRPRSFKGLARASVVTMAALACTIAGAAPAMAADADYASWDRDAGTFHVPGAPYLSGSFTSNASRQAVPSGSSTFLNEDTPFGKEFGSSRGKGYLFFGTAAGKKPSTTTLTFDSPTPVGSWGFALGDIDSDIAQIIAYGADGERLTPAELGFQSAFNYCDGSPLPSVCKGQTGTDVPTWKAGSGSLVGNVTDTEGASGWFKPKVPIKELTIVFKWQAGIPVGQLWIAAEKAVYPPTTVRAPAPPPVKGEPEIVITKTAKPRNARPGDIVHYKIKVANKGDTDEPNAQFTDDLSDVLDDARYRGDAEATGGTLEYDKPQLTWRGSLDSGASETVTFSVKIREHETGDGKVRNVILGAGPAVLCQDGKGLGCRFKVKVPKKYLSNCRIATGLAFEAARAARCRPVGME